LQSIEPVAAEKQNPKQQEDCIMKKVLKWTAIVIGGLLALVLILAGGLYLFAPDPIIIKAEADIAASPEAVFEQFTTYDYWYELWDAADTGPTTLPRDAGAGP
jgi:hypothetical protein